MASVKPRVNSTKNARTERPESGARASNRRGSPEAIEKRRIARVFNDLLGGRGSSAQKLDGRTERRRLRLLKELELGTGRGARELKALDVLQRVQELLELGEPLSAIKKVAKARKSTIGSDAIVGVVERLHRAYAFRPEVYRFVGIDESVLRDAGVLDAAPRRSRAR
jgi:hypothetical protein